VDGNRRLETSKANEPRKNKASLGESLVAARERLGLSREALIEQTHIPGHYVQMLEQDDYHRIADQLYLLPFLRKYASFVDIDQDETAMRLVREVQRLDNNPSSVRLDEPLDDSRRKRGRNWTTPILFGSLIVVIIGAYIAQSHHNDSDVVTAPKLQSSASFAEPSSAYASKEMMTSVPTGQPHGSPQ
jgi:cytoskeleton protein RodZ